jgi:putative ABC transport system permease protein
MILSKNIKFSIRSLLNNKTTTALNICGLTVGITVSMFIFLFVWKETNTDKSIFNIHNIYVLTNNKEIHFSQSMVNHIKKDVPEISDVTYCSTDWSPQVFLANNKDSYKVNRMITADSSFFRVFQFKTIWGNPQKAFNSANKIVLTRSLSEKIFGKENPVGKPVVYNSTYLKGEEIEIVAVIDDLPQTVSWEFEAALSLQTNYKIDWYLDNMKSWGSKNYRAFARLNEHVPENVVLSKLSNINIKEVPDEYKDDLHYGMVPFEKAYFELPQLDIIRHGDKFFISVIGVIGVLILLLACVNYVNMVTAQREKRYKNIGIFKTLGSSSKRILELTTTESVVQLLLAGFISFAVTTLLLPAFNLLSGSAFSASDFYSMNYFLIFLLVSLLMIFLTGIIPGFIYSKKPAGLLIIKNQSGGNNWLRNGLLIFQFTVSIALIISIMFIYKQNRFLQKQNTGFYKENIVYAYTNDKIAAHIDAFKSELRRINGIDDFTFSQNVLVNNDQNWGRNLINNGEEYHIGFSKMSVASNFFDFFGIKLAEGVPFNENSEASRDFIFNKKAKTEFRIANLENARVSYANPQKGHVIGIINDYNFESLHVPIRAAGFACSSNFGEVIYLRTDLRNLASFKTSMKQVEQLWNGISPSFPFEYKFLDQTYATLYDRDTQFQRLLLYTTLISLVLSCLGLIGLTFFVVEQRTKEIGIRKVNGAKISEVLSMLNRDFVKWIGAAFIIASPISYYAISKWLESFAYKTSLSWWIFALAGVLALGIALLTVSWQSLKAATRNPIEALRYE